jgi:hypothetical protein
VAAAAIPPALNGTAIEQRIALVADEYSKLDILAMHPYFPIFDVGGERVIVKHDVKERLMHINAPIIFKKAKFAKAIHEETHTRTCGADHICEGRLCEIWDQCLGLSSLRLYRIGHLDITSKRRNIK